MTRPPPQPAIPRWYAPHFKKFTAQMTCLGHTDTHAPLPQARQILVTIALPARPRQPNHNQRLAPARAHTS